MWHPDLEHLEAASPDAMCPDGLLPKVFEVPPELSKSDELVLGMLADLVDAVLKPLVQPLEAASNGAVLVDSAHPNNTFLLTIYSATFKHTLKSTPPQSSLSSGVSSGATFCAGSGLSLRSL